MRRISILVAAMALVCEACQPLPDMTLAGPIPGQPQPAPTAGAQPPACSSYTVPLTVGGQPQQAVVEACPQADGSWRITQTTPGLPPQVYEVPAPAASPSPSTYAYPGGYPYPDFSNYWDWVDSGWGGWSGGPWFFGLAPSIVVVQRFNHFHHGFHHGFAHGFGHGMHGFGGHGFAGMHGGGMGGGHR
jgi:hypothetical protein